MPHLDFATEGPGILQPLTDYPDTASPLNELAEKLLRSDEGITRGERELIAAHVSTRNGCMFCANAHLNVARVHLGLPPRTIDPAADDAGDGIEVRPVVAALLAIASKVQADGRSVTPDDVAAARAEGATDLMIHDTVLIAAAIAMYNRYVDGLATLTPEDPGAYAVMGNMLASAGYLRTPVGS